MKRWKKWSLAASVAALLTSSYTLAALAQEVEMGIDILLQTGQQAPKKQEQATYTIVDEFGKMIWEHVANQESQNPLVLPPGKYYLRLYDGQEFERDGLAVSVRKLEIKMGNQDQPKKLASKGKILQDEQGKKYYEVPFTVEQVDQQEEVKVTFAFYFATEDVPQEAFEETNSDTQTNQPAAELGQVKFTIKDAQQQPLVKEAVTVQDKTYYTNEQGEIIIELPAGEYPYTMGGLDAENGPNTFSVSPGQQTALEFVMEAAPTVSELTVTIVDEAGTPVVGQEVSVGEMGADGVIVKTDELGQAHVNNLTPGQYLLHVVNLSEEYGQPEDVKVDLGGSENTNVTITLPTHQATSQTVRLKFVDETQQPVANVQLQLNQQLYVSDASGMIQIPDLLPGEYVYQLQVPENYEEVTEGRFTLSEQGTEMSSVTLKKKAPQARTVKLQVIADDSTPVQGATVVFANQTAVTDASGIVTFDNITNGTYSYSIQTLPKGYVGSVTGQYEVTEQADMIVLSVEKEKAQPQTRPLEVIVEDQHHQRIANVTIQVSNQTVITNEEGIARFEQVPTGIHTYQVSTIPQGYTGTLSGEFEMPADTDHRLTITLEKPRPLATISVKVVDHQGKGLSGATVQLGGLTVVTDGNGFANFGQIEAGNYQLTVPGVPQGYQSSNINKSLTLAEGAKIEEVVTLQAIPTVGKVSIKVIDAKGQGVPNATVKLNQQSYQTNQSGIIVVDSLAPGTYTYQLASAPPEYEQTTPPLKFELVAGQEVNRSIQLTAKGTTAVSASSASTQSGTTTTDESKVKATKKVGLPLTGEQVMIGIIPIILVSIAGGVLLMKRKDIHHDENTIETLEG